MAAVLCCPGRADAQRSTPAASPAPKPDPWFFRFLAYPTYDGDEGFQGHLLIGWKHGANRRPPSVSKSLTVEGRLATSGTRGAILTYDAPGWWQDWRVLGVAGAERLERAPFYGGNTSQIQGGESKRYFRYELFRTTLYGAVQRHLAGPLRLHLAAQWRHYHAQPLDDSTAFAKFIGPGPASDSIPRSILELRGGLLYDTRDYEDAPTHGVFLETMLARAPSNPSYTRYLLSAREFLPSGYYQQWVFGFRQTAELAAGPLPIAVAYERLTTWYPEDGFGGARSLRLYDPGRFVAPNRVIASADVRYKLLDAPFPTSPIRVWLLGFADVGRLWEAHETPSFSQLHWSAGAGGRLQFGKGSLFGLDLGFNDEGFGFSVTSAFAF